MSSVASIVLGVLPLSTLCGDLISNVILLPILLAVGHVADLPVYADLSAAESQPTVEAESLS